MRYHNATRPNDHLISDRIETLRSFMSQRVIDHLGGFMRPHPRFKTTEGWEHWTQCVRDRLYSHDPTSQDSVAGVIKQYKQRNLTERALWQKLDELVCDGKISSAQQRQLFWDALSPSSQEKLTRRAAYFDPNHEIWNSRELVLATEQQLLEIMECENLKISTIDPFNIGVGLGIAVGIVAVLLTCAAKWFFNGYQVSSLVAVLGISLPMLFRNIISVHTNDVSSSGLETSDTLTWPTDTGILNPHQRDAGGKRRHIQFNIESTLFNFECYTTV